MLNFEPKTFLASVPNHPGIYQMFDERNEVLYVGKARNLKKRLVSYFRAQIADSKTQALMKQVAHITITITASENEALLLESTLIKKLLPRYNVLLRDDKSYPYLFLSAHPDYPRLDIHRGAKREKGDYYGPYPSASAVHETLDILQKLFKIRQCNDHFFKSRVRPCLQYQIKRCTAPCVGYIDPKTYQQNIHFAVLFLQGKNTDVINALVTKMEQASAQLAFEEAARLRDQIISLRRIQERQYINIKEGDIDIIASLSQAGVACVHILFIRGGRLIGNKSYFPKTDGSIQEEEVLSAFLPQYYLSTNRGESIPKHIIVNHRLTEKKWIENALSEQLQKTIKIMDQTRGGHQQRLKMAEINARHALMSYLTDQMHFYQRLEAFQTALKLPNLPQRIECFDISHTMGEATVASCVVFDTDGARKQDYRRFNINGIKPGDDYAAIAQALSRRYAKLKTANGLLPDVIMIDGGKGQLSVAEKVLEEIQVSGVILMSIAKGEGRKPGLETVHISGENKPLCLAPDSQALHVIQQIRDEAHRFAITGHRKRRAKSRNKSFLENIVGIGAKRRRDLLNYFGGLQEIKGASAEEIAKTPGISKEIAQRIYDLLHDGSSS